MPHRWRQAELTETVHYSIDKVPLIKGSTAVYSKAILQQEYKQTRASNNAYQLSELRSELRGKKKHNQTTTKNQANKQPNKQPHKNTPPKPSQTHKKQITILKMLPKLNSFIPYIQQWNQGRAHLDTSNTKKK